MEEAYSCFPRCLSSHTSIFLLLLMIYQDLKWKFLCFLLRLINLLILQALNNSKQFFEILNLWACSSPFFAYNSSPKCINYQCKRDNQLPRIFWSVPRNSLTLSLILVKSSNYKVCIRTPLFPACSHLSNKCLEFCSLST